MTTALLVIDVQNDFVADGGFFDKIGGDVRTIQQKRVPNLLRLIGEARQAGVLDVAGAAEALERLGGERDGLLGGRQLGDRDQGAQAPALALAALYVGAFVLAHVLAIGVGLPPVR